MQNGQKGKIESKTDFRKHLAEEIGMEPQRFNYGRQAIIQLANSGTPLTEVKGVRIMTDPQNPDQLQFDVRMHPAPQDRSNGHGNGNI